MTKYVFVQLEQLSDYRSKGKACEEYIRKIYDIVINSEDRIFLLCGPESSQEMLSSAVECFQKMYREPKIINYTDALDAVEKIKETIGPEDRDDKIRYIIIASKEIKELTWAHHIHASIGWSKFVDDANYAIWHGFWCENPRIDYFGHSLAERRFEKVIFLDIDGVLNTDDHSADDWTPINEQFVQNLAYIVKKTDAEIILTSSWRYKLASDSRLVSCKMDENVKLLLDMLDKYNLHISGITPLRFNGADGRPFEIRLWLSDKPDVKNYVILDDEDFWKWGHMATHFVKTADLCFDDRGYAKEKCGLTLEYAKKAVEILNGK